MDYLDIFRSLNEQNVDYIIVGGVAATIHGNPRMTFDVDLVVELTDENLENIFDLLKKWGYETKIPEDPARFAKQSVRTEWIQEKNMQALNFYNHERSVSEIDLLVNVKDYRELNENKTVYEVEDVVLPVASIEDLIDMKKKAGREVDETDIRNLKLLLEEKKND
jgi:predicted nucleotidyltransferase